MQRVLSGQTARCIESSEEFVSKRLCVSFIIVCAFFSMLGGFFLGRHTAEKQAAKSGTAIKNQYSDTINQLSISILKLSNLTTIFALIPSSKIGPYNYTQLYNNLHCNCNKNFLPDLEKFENNPLLTVSELITLDLNVLLECYNNASRFLEGILSF